MDTSTAIQIIIGLIVGVLSWVIRLLQGKLEHLEKKITDNSRDHYTKDADQEAKIAVLFERTKDM